MIPPGLCKGCTSNYYKEFSGLCQNYFQNIDELYGDPYIIWTLSPDDKTVQVSISQEDASIWKTYEAGAVLPSAAIEGLSVNLSEVFAEQVNS
ncbi:hypothetical protein TREAZ_2758 [Leadbettera azotonutricia ZAS-9]|uniref:Uncharacterized protein n=1 Tax=Leadbettera azotonutricia (strain ATCC BAA-888 / DSM 13862 / ZAS-9) TaxID=545695 RepID=F5YD56_LEAAZ|nr:hypothetical protein TREAZ_2758 [Leadbettera azotonutricia ZAS-9]